jgi:hypothetical protein
MTLMRLDYQLRAAFPDNPDGYYYWTNTFYFDYDMVPSSHSALYKTVIGISHIHSIHVFRNRFILTAPPHGTTVLLNAGELNQHCDNADVTSFILENVARVSLWVGSKYVGYKLLRGVVGTDEITDGVIDEGRRSEIQGQIDAWWMDAPLLTATGETIDRAVVDRNIQHWQHRHGTKRRQRVVLAPP